MEQAVDTGKDKVKQICEVLRKETLEPAAKEAAALVAKAKSDAEAIVAEAKAKAAGIVQEAETQISKREAIFKASLNQGARQSIEWLKQEIEERLFNKNLMKMLGASTSSPQVLADMVSAVVKAVADEGLETDLSAVIPSAVEARAVNELLAKEIVERLKEKSVLMGSQKGGVEVKLLNENITIDLTDSSLFELMTRYVRKDFHQYFFNEKG